MQHFNKLPDIERNVLDLREYRISHMGLRDQETRKKELFVSKKNVYERAFPILVQEKDLEGQLAMHSELSVQKKLSEL